jgi:hypothetical protein
MVDVPITDAIQQLREELRKAILEGKGQEIVFTPNEIEVELSVSFKAEKEGHGGIKVFAFLDLSASAQAGRESLHKIKLSFSVADSSGNPLKMRSSTIPHFG